MTVACIRSSSNTQLRAATLDNMRLIQQKHTDVESRQARMRHGDIPAQWQMCHMSTPLSSIVSKLCLCFSALADDTFSH